MMPFVWVWVLGILNLVKAKSDNEAKFISANDFVEDMFFNVPCKIDFNQLVDASADCCTNRCGRRVLDGVFSDNDVNSLLQIVNKGMAQRESKGGPTILDINTGYIRDTDGLDNLFLKNTVIYSENDFTHYGNIIKVLKDKVAETFSIKELYFTAPTFITRLDGDSNWKPQSLHDEYWHPHADHNNTAHYHYSGLLYLNTHKKDFTGGNLIFLNPDNYRSPMNDDEVAVDEIELQIEPRAGRVVIFTAGHENTHYVQQVTSGQRYVLSFWFTCDAHKEFEIFLDGKAHISFTRKFRTATQRKYSQQQAVDKERNNRQTKAVEKEL